MKKVTIKLLQDELDAQEKSQKEFLEMLEKQRFEKAMEDKKRAEEEKVLAREERNLLMKQRQDLQAEVGRACIRKISCTGHH